MAAKAKDKVIDESIPSSVNAGAETVDDDNVIDIKKAKKEKKKRDKMAAKAGKKKNKVLIPLIIFLLIIGALGAVIGLNAFGLRDRYLTGILKDIPIVNQLLPAGAQEADPYASVTKEAMAAEMESLQAEIERNKTEIQSLNQKSNDYVQEISRLREIEGQQLALKAEKEEFDRMIAMNDPTAYTKFYPTIDPTNAETLYKEAVVASQATKEIKDYVATYSAMDAGNAAAIFEQLVPTDMNLVVTILKNMNSDIRGQIIAEMTPTVAASVTKMLNPNG